MRKCIAIADAVCEPRRADARRSWLCIRQPLDNVRFSRHGVRFTEPRRADARRSWLCIRQPLDNVRFSRHGVRFTEPRRADARRSCERAFVHRKWRFVR
jgi:NOL1/NOP2/fmu family ribosome biogenesis protein